MRIALPPTRRASLLIVWLCALTAGAQREPANPPNTYKLIAVKATGSKRFTSQEIAAASGLPAGTVAHQDDFQKAARQLGQSGAFSNIDFTYTYSGEGTILEFRVADADKFVPARFNDFVWFTQTELIRRLHERIPLFDGELPTNGNLAGEVSDVLQAMLDEKGIPGQVQLSPAQDKSGKTEAVEFSVAGVSIRIHHAEFPGAGPSELPLLQAAAEGIYDREYSREYMDNFAKNQILPIFRKRGFLRATCSAAEPRVVKPKGAEPDANGQPRTYVDVTFPVSAGEQYKLSGWEWSGNKVISTAELQPLIRAKRGEAADTLALQSDLKKVQQLYGSRGYVLATVKVEAVFDDPAATVAYRLEVNEGALFRMGELELRGLDNVLTAKLRDAWKLRPGDVYDSSYLQDFLGQARKLLPSRLDWDVASHVTAIPTEKAVDVDLEYTAKAPR